MEFAIPNDWPSGVYVGMLTAERDGWQSDVIFIVRDDRPCDFLFQFSDATWLAYNRWPNRHQTDVERQPATETVRRAIRRRPR